MADRKDLDFTHFKDLLEMPEFKDTPRIDDIVGDVFRDFFGTDPGKGSASEIYDEMVERAEHATDLSALTPSSGNEDRPASPADPYDAGAAPQSAPSSRSDTVSEGQADTEQQKEQAQAAAEKKPEKSGMEQLDELIGLGAVKEDVRELVNFVKMQQLRKEKGLRSVPVSLHLVFSGSPGTGKTTVARILAQLYKEIGALSKGQLVEVDRSGLVAGYVGQTAIKTQKKIDEAMGGVLFIDEAYTLNKDGSDYGQEAIDTILKAMEDHRDDFVVIVAGYTELMKKFIDSNPGLKSRFNKYIEFADYTTEELLGIFNLQCKKYSYTLSDEAREQLTALIESMVAHKRPDFSNARTVRNLFETIITNQATRLSEVEDPTDEELTTIETADLKEVIAAEEAAQKAAAEAVKAQTDALAASLTDLASLLTPDEKQPRVADSKPEA